MRTVYNQYDSLVRPLKAWLDEHGVSYVLGAKVTDLRFIEDGDGKAVERVVFEKAGVSEEIAIGPGDYVIVTLGSMTEASDLGSNTAPPALNGKREGGALDALGEDRRGPPGVRKAIRLRRSHRRIKMGFIHGDAARSGLLHHHSRLHRQHARRGRPHHLRGFELAHVDRAAAPAALHRPAARRQCVLGLWTSCRCARRFRP
ncbi:protein of unknown function [Methylocella tundrae]|uniref:Uncharacterized protein n=1 Tax=Methylocella tundrae TaxID=227605 RepID=A0A4U8Z492_METTU|nr:protein of unknown function [Methylocella tundrae]